MDRGNLATYTGEHLSIISSFSKVKAGDYFCVISGPRLLGLARARHDYDFAKAASDKYDFQTVRVEWIERFDIPVLLNSTQTKTFCVLNYGRRWDSLKQGLEERGYRFASTTGGASGTGAERRTHYLVTFHQSYSYEDFIEGIKPVMDHEAEEEESTGQIMYSVEPGIFYRACDMACQFADYADLEAALRDTREGRQERFAGAEPFYLVIDEINRGNVANIFGELITLVETDKRLGNENELIVELPYSKASFGVPSNLYLIGTMNTADRSVESLDAALRRRFSFIDCPPDPSVIANPDGFEVDLRKLLEAINARIELVLDRDHRIGHAYFTSIAESEDPLEALREAFRLKVIPQLEEYCYGATEKIARILGPGFIRREEAKFELFAEDGAVPDDDRSVWKIEIPADAAAFKALYEQGIRSSS